MRKGKRMNNRTAEAQNFIAMRTFTADICQGKKKNNEEQTGHTLPNKLSNTLRLTLFIQVGKKNAMEGSLF